MGAHRRGGGLAQGGRGARLSRADERVCRVVPDVPAVDRAFDYIVPSALAARTRVGVIVRVPLHGRRVRGWVVDDDVVPEAAPSALRPLLAVSSAGPPHDLVALSRWAAWRWAGPRAVFLRAASPPNNVEPGIVDQGDPPVPRVAVFPPAVAPLDVPDATPRLVVWPPAVDRVPLLRALLGSEGSTIVVVPDGAETTRLEQELTHDGRDVIVLRGDAPAAHRTQQWDEARHGACVVLGGRIAALAPVPDLTTAIVLDDADEAHQEERAPTWHARDLLEERSRVAGASFTVVTPVPTVEVAAATTAVTRAPRTIERDGWPQLEIVDRRDDPPGAGIASLALGPALRRALDGGRALCVLNRRGRARILACRSCREIARCARCGAAVAEAPDGLACPRCSEARPFVCLECGGARFHAVRPGVGRARDAVAGLVPRAHVTVLEGGGDEIAEGDVVVGTEAAFHRMAPDGPPVRLVAFLEFDQELLAARYRAAEQALWLLVRAGRMVGPRRGSGRVLVQTRLPDHEVLRAARDANPSEETEVELGRRRALALPPFGGLAEVSGKSEAVDRACDALRGELEVRGPVDGHALARAPSVDALCDAFERVDLTPARALGRLRIAVDPARV